MPYGLLTCVLLTAAGLVCLAGAAAALVVWAFAYEPEEK